MRNTTLNNKTLGITLFAGALALAAMVPAHAQILGGGGITGGITGGMNGPINSAMGQVGGQIGGSARGMGNLHAPDINQRAAGQRAERLRQRAAATAASATDTAAQAARQVNGQAAADAAAGLTGATGANAGNGNGAALGGTGQLGSSAAGAVDTSGTRDAVAGTVDQAVGQSRSAVSTAKRDTQDALNRAQNEAGNASANAEGAAEGSAIAGLGVARRATATGTQSAQTGSSVTRSSRTFVSTSVTRHHGSEPESRRYPDLHRHGRAAWRNA